MKSKFILVLFILLLAPYSFGAELKNYNFSKLYKDLSYLESENFGASEEEIEALNTYTTKEDSFYRDINAYLRAFPDTNYDWYGVSPEDSKKIVKNLDRYLTRVPNIPNNIVLYRGVDLKRRKNKSFVSGEEFIEKGYLSTSTSYKVAYYFANEMNDRARNGTRKGIFVLYSTLSPLKAILIDQGEDEALLKHSQKIRIMQVKTKKNYDIYLAQICSQVCLKEASPEAKRFFKKF